MAEYKLEIKKYRILNGMTQKELAAKIGISQNFLSEIENNKFDIRLSLLLKIALELHVSLYDLID